MLILLLLISFMVVKREIFISQLQLNLKMSNHDMSFTQITPHTHYYALFFSQEGYSQQQRRVGIWCIENNNNKKIKRARTEKGAKIRLRLSTPYVCLCNSNFVYYYYYLKQQFN